MNCSSAVRRVFARRSGPHHRNNANRSSAGRRGTAHIGDLQGRHFSAAMQIIGFCGFFLGDAAPAQLAHISRRIFSFQILFREFISHGNLLSCVGFWVFPISLKVSSASFLTRGASNNGPTHQPNRNNHACANQRFVHRQHTVYA